MAPNHSCNHVTLLEKVRLKALRKCRQASHQVPETAEIVYAEKKKKDNETPHKDKKAVL